MLCINQGDTVVSLPYFVSADKSGKSGKGKRRLSPSWSTPDPKQVKLTHVDKTGYFIICLQYNIEQT